MCIGVWWWRWQWPNQWSNLDLESDLNWNPWAGSIIQLWNSGKDFFFKFSTKHKIFTAHFLSKQRSKPCFSKIDARFSDSISEGITYHIFTFKILSNALVKTVFFLDIFSQVYKCINWGKKNSSTQIVHKENVHSQNLRISQSKQPR